jgi:hypothetical protein
MQRRPRNITETFIEGIVREEEEHDLQWSWILGKTPSEEEWELWHGCHAFIDE